MAAALTPAGVLAVVQAISNIESAEEVQVERLRSVAERAAAEETAALLLMRERVRAAGRIPKDIQPDGSCSERVEELIRQDDRFTLAVRLNGQGDALCGASPGFSVAESAVWKRFAEAPDFVISEAEMGRISGEPVVIAYVPTIDDDGEFGALGVGVRTQYLRDIMLRERSDARAPRSDTVRLALMSGAGALIGANRVGQEGWLPADDVVFANDGHLEAESVDGDNLLYVTWPVLDGELFFVAGERAQTFWETLLGPRGFAVVAPILLWLIAVSVAHVAIDRLVLRHVIYLERVAAAIGRGHLDLKIGGLDGAPEEVGRLGDALRRMMQSLAQREASLREALDTKQALLLEIHHRVKNNLQMISSLMNLQLRRADDKAERASLQLVQDRIHSLAAVHQNLYSAEQLDRVALDQLITDVVGHLHRSFQRPGRKLAVSRTLDKIVVPADTATAAALFVTEAVSNAVKHHAGDDDVAIAIALKERADESFSLVVSNRTATTPRIVEDTTEGLGTRLMRGFARQVGGSMDQRYEDGEFVVSLTAPLTPRNTGFALRSATRSPRTEARGSSASGAQPVAAERP